MSERPPSLRSVITTLLVAVVITVGHAVRVAAMNQPDPMMDPMGWFLSDPRVSPVYGVMGALAYWGVFHYKTATGRNG